MTTPPTPDITPNYTLPIRIFDHWNGRDMEHRIEVLNLGGGTLQQSEGEYWADIYLQDSTGTTPVGRRVRELEQRIAELEESMQRGDKAFSDLEAMYTDLVFDKEKLERDNAKLREKVVDYFGDMGRRMLNDIGDIGTGKQEPAS